MVTESGITAKKCRKCAPTRCAKRVLWCSFLSRFTSSSNRAAVQSTGAFFALQWRLESHYSCSASNWRGGVNDRHSCAIRHFPCCHGRSRLLVGTPHQARPQARCLEPREIGSRCSRQLIHSLPFEVLYFLLNSRSTLGRYPTAN